MATVCYPCSNNFPRERTARYIFLAELLEDTESWSGLGWKGRRRLSNSNPKKVIGSGWIGDVNH